MAELRELTKKLLGYGARVPKELMLFVKNMMFLDGATATLAPTSTSSARWRRSTRYFQEHYGEQHRCASSGSTPSEPIDFDLDAVKAGFRLGPETATP